MHKNTMADVKAHFEEEASYFDHLIPTLIPYYQEMLNALILAIPFDKSHSFKAIDIGSGTGTVAKKIKENFPLAQITCIDFSENMLNIAKFKLSAFPDIRFIESDFSHYDFSETYDVVLSSLSLHHLLNDRDKIIFYRKIFSCLSQGGTFYNADVVLGSNEHLQKIYMKKWNDHMRKNISEEEIQSKWNPSYEREDRPSKLVDQLRWLIDIGFNEVEVIWKYYNFAVYGGKKV